MSWREKIVGATIIYELLLVAPITWLMGNMTDFWIQLFSTQFDWTFLARVIIVIILNALYGMGLLFIMGLIDFAKRNTD